MKAIAKQVGVAVSSVSVWVRDVEVPPARPAPTDAHDPPVATDEPTKYCSHCDRELPLSAFNRNGDGHQHWCRECFRFYFRERGQRHRDQSRASREKRREAARAHVRAHLEAHACVDCGEHDLAVLEFDHCRGTKRADIARLIGTGARIDRLAREIDCCDVVCVNCHRRRTATRAQTFRVTGVPPTSWPAFRVRNASFLLEVLRGCGCADCGEDDPLVLDFDHVDGKTAGIARLVAVSSLARLREEVERCVVRCANCHRMRTLVEGAAWRAEGHWAQALHDDPQGGSDAKPSMPPARLELARFGLKVRCSTN